MKIYFAGAETIDANAPQLIEGGAKNIFVSYYHLVSRTRNPSVHARVLHAYSQLGIRQIIDSGAFTFMNAAKKASKSKSQQGGKTAGSAAVGDVADVLVSLEDYFRTYIAWVETNWNLVTDFIELDMQRIVGPDPVTRWRRILRERGLLSKVWMVHHSCDDWGHFERLIEASKVQNGGSGHCGIEGKNLSKAGQIDYVRHARYAYEHGVCIHAFASTRAKFLNNVPLTSSDSSTWKQASRFAVSQIYDPIHGGVISRRHGEGGNVRGTGDVVIASRAWIKFMVSDAPAIERVRATTQLEVDAVRAFRQMEDAVTAMWKERGVDWRRVEDAIANHKARRA